MSNPMKTKRFLRWALLAAPAVVALSAGAFIIPRLFWDTNRRIKEEIRQLECQSTPVTLEEVTRKQNLQEVNLSVEIYLKNYEFRTRRGSFRIILLRSYNLSENLFGGRHSVGFDYSNLERKSRPKARKIEALIEKDPLIGERASTLYSFFTKHAREIRATAGKICVPGETATFDRFLSDLEELIEEDRFSVERPFQAVLINHYRPGPSHDTPNKLDREIGTRLLSSRNQFTYVSRDEVERLNQIFEEKADKGEFDVKQGTVHETIQFFAKTIPPHFRMYKGEVMYEEKKNRLNPSAILGNPNRIEVSCGPPALYLARLINYANEVNPNFRHIHAFLIATADFKKGRKGREYARHAIVGLVDTESRKISFLAPYPLVILPFVKPIRYNGSEVTTSYRRELIGGLPGSVGHSAAGLSWRQFLDESRRNLRRKY